MAIEDEYDAFCFDEACAYFLSELSAEKQPHFPEDEKANPTLNKLITGLLQNGNQLLFYKNKEV